MPMLRIRPFFIAEDICTHRIGSIEGVCVTCGQLAQINPINFEPYKRTKNETIK